MKSVENAINNYLKSKDNLCLLIDGPWGSGKTYYVKEFIEKYNTEDDKIKETNIVYFSVFGYDNLNSLKKSFYSNVFIKNFDPNHKESIESFISPLGRISKKIQAIADLGSATFDLYLKQCIESMQQQIFFIDDLERISDNIKLDDFFGFIYSLISGHTGIKVILVGNMNEIELDRNDQKFEKIINHTVQFNYNSNAISSMIYNELEGSFILENDNSETDWVLKMANKIIEQTQNISLRIVQTALQNYELLEKSIDKSIEIDEKISLCKSIFLDTMIITIEHKLGEITKNNFYELFSITDKVIAKIDANDLVIDGASYKIYNKYHKMFRDKDFDDFIYYFSAINHHIVYGSSSEKFDLNSWKENYDNKSIEIDTLITSLSEYQLFSQTEKVIRKVQEKLFILLENSKFDMIDQLFNLLLRISYLNNKELLFYKKSEEWENIIVNNFNRLLSQNNLSFDDLNIEYTKHFSEELTLEFPIISNFLQYALKNIKIKAIDKYVEEGIHGVNHLVYSNMDDEFKIGVAKRAFKYILDKNFITTYTLKEVESNAYFMRSTIIIMISKKIQLDINELEKLKEIINFIDDEKEKIKDKISLCSINIFQNELEKLKEIASSNLITSE